MKQLNEIADNFRNQFDELKLKPPKGSMPNLERELIVNYWLSILQERERTLREEVEGVRRKHLRGVEILKAGGRVEKALAEPIKQLIDQMSDDILALLSSKEN